jgi:hypothetical protein
LIEERGALVHAQRQRGLQDPINLTKTFRSHRSVTRRHTNLFIYLAIKRVPNQSEFGPLVMV